MARSLSDCLTDAIAAGEADLLKGDDARRAFEELRAAYARTLGEDEAARFAAEELRQRLAARFGEKKRQVLLAATAQARIRARLRPALTDAGGRDIRNGLLNLVEAIGEAPGGQLSMEQWRKAIRGRAHGIMTDALATFRRNLVGQTRNRAKMLNVVREAFGEPTGDVAAKELAQAWRQAAEFLRQRFNHAGGHIGWREDWGLPQAHDSFRVRQAGYEAWRDFVLPKLDPERMIDAETGAAFEPEALETALRGVWETIRTEGWSKVSPSGAAGGRAVGNRRADPRFLVFRGADDWLAYQEAFGTAEPFDAMMAHIDGMARDIGAMMVAGPNPAAGLRYAGQLARKAARDAGDDAGIRRADGAAYALDTAYMHYTGTVNAPENPTVARAFASTRATLTSIQLGSAALSAVGDVAFQRMARKFNGLSTFDTLGGYLKLLSPANEADRKLAVRLGLIAEEWSQMAAAQSRYTGEAVSSEVSARLAQFTLRASGLSAWTQAGRWAFGMEFLGMLGDRAGRRFDALEPELQQALTRYGIGADAWETIRATPLHEERGASFLRPDDIAARGDLGPDQAEDLAMRLLAMVQSETEFAVPSASLRARAVFGGRTAPGSVSGELIRSGLMYKNFGLTLWMTHIRRGLSLPTAAERTTYLGALIVSTTLAGAFALQLKQIAAGRDPRPMNDPSFAAQALMQGGGLGIFGDFVSSAENRFGGGLASTLAGPVVSTGQDLYTLTAGNVTDALAGRETHLGRDAVETAAHYTPGGSIWYARLALERGVYDQLQTLADPGWRADFRRTERRWERDYGQGFWWAKGDALPERAPDLDTALEAQP